MFIDTHCHLFKEYYEDIDYLIENIKNNEVKRVIVSGCDMKSNMEVLELVKKYDIIYGTLGFHPTELENFNIDNLHWLLEHINDDKIVGIGEIGLDYHYANIDKEKQKMVFRRQLELAERYNKPVIIHSRDSIGDTYNILKEYNVKGDIHCFSGSVEMAREFVKIGYYIGVGGIITFKNAKNIIEVVKDIPLSYILLETDAPYLTPEPYRKNINSSSYIPVIAKKVAEVKNVEIKEIAEVTSSNAEALFDFLGK